MSLFKKKETKPVCSAVILAAGSSVRMGADKTVMQLGGMSVIERAVLAFERSEYVDEIILVTKEEKVQELAEQFHEGHEKVKLVVTGGETRTESALAGVSNVKKDAKLIAIHDGARPFVSQKLIADAVCAAEKYYAAMPGIPVNDTLKLTDDHKTSGTLDRSKVVRVQTPQVFKSEVIKGALTYAMQHDLTLTDDSSAVECMGIQTYITEGDERNIKLTTPFDVEIGEIIIKYNGDEL